MCRSCFFQCSNSANLQGIVLTREDLHQQAELLPCSGIVPSLREIFRSRELGSAVVPVTAKPCNVLTPAESTTRQEQPRCLACAGAGTQDRQTTQVQQHPGRASSHGAYRVPGAGLPLYHSELGRKPDDSDQNQVERDNIIQ